MWLFLLLVPRSSESSQVGPVPERAGGLHCSPPVHLIAYTQPIWPAPVHGANTAYILANRFFLDLQIEDVLQVVGSLTWTVFVDRLPRNKSEAFLEELLQVKQEVWLKMAVLLKTEELCPDSLNVALSSM